MIRYTRQLFLFLALAMALMVSSGCTIRSAPQVNYFSLLSMEQLGERVQLGQFSQINLGVGPVSIPESLKRTQIATLEHHNQYQFDEYHRWAGVLEKDLTGVIADNIADMLGIENIGIFPFTTHFTPTYRVIVDVQHFAGSLEGEAILEARWSIVDSGGNIQLASGRSAYRQKVENNSYSGLVTAESYLVAELSEAIAKEIQLLANK